MFQPSKVVGIGLNYFDHTRDMKGPLPDYPTIFLKPSTSVIGSGDDIVYPPQTSELHYEGELAIVIKDKCRNVSPEDARRYVAGYTCANDVSARDLQRMDGQPTRGKSFDTFCPLGPRLVMGIDPCHLKIQTRVNGQVKQDSTTANMIFDVWYLVSYISSIMTLLPGDIIITGTPAGVGALLPGDTVEVEIEAIGILKNRVIR